MYYSKLILRIYCWCVQVQVTSANLTHGTTLKAETKLEGKTAQIVLAKTFVTPSKNKRMV